MRRGGEKSKQWKTSENGVVDSIRNIFLEEKKSDMEIHTFQRMCQHKGPP